MADLIKFCFKTKQGTLQFLISMKNLTRRIGHLRLFLLVFLAVSSYVIVPLHQKSKPTVYQYFKIITGINKGLEVNSKSFSLNGRPLRITCGVIHYFRVHPQCWRDSLRKLRATGAIAVQTSIPWNLHEPLKDVFDFGNRDFEMSPFLDVVNFIQLAKEEDLLVIVGLGPYINAQLDFGGLPSYLISEKVKIRSADKGFLTRVEKYFSNLLPLLEPLQVLNGGPIIMFQMENSYGSIQEPDIDNRYLPQLKNIIHKYNIHCLLFTCDSIAAAYGRGSHFNDDVLKTTTAEVDVLAELETLQTIQTNRPLLVLVRSGIVDTWDSPYHITYPAHEYAETLREALNFPASVSVYMFHGGTSYNFLSGATIGDLPENYHPYTTSFDFDAPLTEAGDYTEKYWRMLELYREVQPHLCHPAPPPIQPRTLALRVSLTHELGWSDIIRQSPIELEGATSFVPMDDLPSVDGRRQNFGFVRYVFAFRVLKRKLKLKLLGLKRDVAIILIDGCLARAKQVGEKQFGFWDSDDQLEVSVRPGVRRMELVVENCGRLSHSHRLDWLGEPKGLTLDNKLVLQFAAPVGKINVSSMPFLASWVASLEGWMERVRFEEKTAPSLVRAVFILSPDQITDTFIDISDWGKGLVFVNGFNIGRYFRGSPQQALYISAHLLHAGENVIVIFEHYYNPPAIQLTPEPIFM